MRFRIAPVQLDAPSRGTQLRDSNEWRNCANKGFSRHELIIAGEINTGTFDRGKRPTLQQTNEHREIPSPSRITWKTRTLSVVCAAAENKDTAPTKQPHRDRGGLFPFAKTFLDRFCDGGRLFRRREKKEITASDIKAQLADFCTIQPPSFGTAVGAGV